mgnify:CR=1 FL=1
MPYRFIKRLLPAIAILLSASPGMCQKIPPLPDDSIVRTFTIDQNLFCYIYPNRNPDDRTAFRIVSKDSPSVFSIHDISVTDTETADSCLLTLRDSLLARPSLAGHALIAAGDFDTGRIEGRIREIFGNTTLYNGKAINPIINNVRISRDTIAGMKVITDTCAVRHRFLICWENEALPAELGRTAVRYSDDMIREIISRSLNRRLQVLSADPHSLVTDAVFKYCDTYCCKDTASVTFTVKGNDTDKSLRTLLAEIEKVINHGFTDEEIRLAKYDILEEYRSAADSAQPLTNEEITGLLTVCFLQDRPFIGPEYRKSLTERTLPLLDDETINQTVTMSISADNMSITHICPAKNQSGKKAGKQKKTRRKSR